MSTERPVIILSIALVLATILIAGCSVPGQKKDNSSRALDVVLRDQAVRDDIARSGGSYTSDVQPADLNTTGYLNYSGNFYRVIINTASRGQGGPYLEQFDVLVDVYSGREMQVGRRFDVAIYPENISIPSRTVWYHRFQDTSSWAYIEVNVSTLNESVRPMLVDEDNFLKLRQGMPFSSWSLYSLGENATAVNLDSNNSPIVTGIDGITVMPGRIPLPGLSANGYGIKITFKDPGRYYYLLVNDGPADVSVESTVLG